MSWLLIAALLSAPVVTRKHANYTDSCEGSCTRTIQTDINYQDHNDQWHATDQQIEVTATEPDAWTGPVFNFTRKVERGPVQVWFRDLDTPGDDARTNVGIRDTRFRGRWMQVRHLGVGAGISCSVNAPRRGFECQDAWTDAHTGYYLLRRGIRTVIRLDSASAPGTYDRAIRIPLAATMALDGDGNAVVSVGGEPRLKVAKPIGWDSTGGGNYEGPSPGSNIYTASWSIENETTSAVARIYTLRMTIGDTTGAAWPVYFE